VGFGVVYHIDIFKTRKGMEIVEIELKFSDLKSFAIY